MGVNKGLFKLFPNRYDESGNKVASCVGTEASPLTSYGDACTAVLEAYKSTIGTPTPLCKGSAECDAEAFIKCFTGNNSANVEKLGTANCDLVPMGNGFS